MSAKDLLLKPISAAEANEIVKKIHYSGKVVPNSQIHIGIFYGGKLEGAMQFGPAMVKKNIINLVSGTKWNGFMELNRMAFSEALPKNSESRAISIAMKLLKKHAPNLEWILTFADATQCGDGTIYRASGFVLTGIKKNDTLRIDPLTGEPKQAMAVFHEGRTQEFAKWKKLDGYQLRYIYFLNKSAKSRLTVKEIPFDEIAKIGAKMYRGKRLDGVTINTPSVQDGTSGVNPTSRLQN